MHAIIFALSFFLTSLFLTTPIFASAPVVTNQPSNLNLDESFTLSVSMDGLSINTIYRLRIVFSKSGTSNYFGSTFNGTEWYNGTPSPINYAKFLSISTDTDGKWSGSIQGKIESSDSNFKNESGDYDLKVGRYTENGSSATWSNISSVNITAPTPTPSPTPDPTPTPTPESESTQKPDPTNSPTPTPVSQKKSPTPKPKSSLSPSPQVLAESTHEAQELRQDASPSPSPIPKNNSRTKVAAVVTGSGVFLIILSGVFYFMYRRLEQKDLDEKDEQKKPEI